MLRNFRSCFVVGLVGLAACQGSVVERGEVNGGNDERSGGGRSETREPKLSAGSDQKGGNSSNGGLGGGGALAPVGPSAGLKETPAGRGLFDCPAVEAPVYEDGSAKGVSVSAAFGRYCTGCHGGAGEGQGLYPALPGKLDEAAYVQAVRQGRDNKAMPAFGIDILDEATLRADYAALKTLASNGRKPTQSTASAQTWTETQVNDAYKRGMVAWRKPDSQGAACASCHSPDAIDLAVIAYPDAAVMRRGALHIPADDVLAIRDLIHAQRRRFGIKNPCSADWRPFQPGGEVLPGNTPQEQDASLGASLASGGLLLMTEAIGDAEAAKKAFRQFAQLDLRRTPIGIALPHWTRDPFNGSAHQTFDDWIGAVDFTPNLGALISASDAYLASASDETYFALERAALGSLGNANAGQFHDWFNNASRGKRRSILLGSHYFRMALLKQNSWYELPLVPYPKESFRYSPFALMGGMTQEFGCSPSGGSFAGGRCEDLMNRIAVSERPKFGGPTEAQMSPRFDSFTHTWWTMANLFDQGMLRSEDNAIDGGMFYWAGRFPQGEVHMPLFYAHAFAVRWLYQSDHAGKPSYPVVSALSRQPLLLDGSAITDRTFPGLVGKPSSEDSAAFEWSVIFRSNLLRSILLMQKELLDGGATVVRPEGLLSLYETALPNAGWYSGGLVELWNKPEFEARHPRLAGKKQLLATGLNSLMTEVIAKIKKAPVGNSSN